MVLEVTAQAKEEPVVQAVIIHQAVLHQADSEEEMVAAEMDSEDLVMVEQPVILLVDHLVTASVLQGAQVVERLAVSQDQAMEPQDQVVQEEDC